MPVVRMHLGEPVVEDRPRRSAALVYTRDLSILTGWEVTEPELVAEFAGRDVAYFEAEEIGGQLKIGRRVPDQVW